VERVGRACGVTGVILVLLCRLQIDQRAWVRWFFLEVLFTQPVILWLRNARFIEASSHTYTLSL